MGDKFPPPEFLIIGRVLAPWGTGGELKVQITTDFLDRFASGRLVYIEGQPLQIESSRPQKQHLRLKLAGVDTRQDAGKLRGHDITIPRTEIRSLPEGEYYAFQLIGLAVETTSGNQVGSIIDLMTTASNDVYVVQSERGEILIPAIEDVVKSIDLENGKVVIEAIEGLLGTT